MSGRLDGQSAIVTGAAQGIGRAIAQRLAEDGARVTVADINAKGADTAASEIGQGAVGVACDVSDSEAVDALIEGAARDGAPDILVNNAAIVPFIAWDDVDLDHWRKILDVNLTSVFMTCRKATDMMRTVKREGRIVNIASNTFFAGTPNMAAYVAAKGGIIGFTRALAIEIGKDGIRVNALCPVAGETPLLTSFMGEDTPEIRAKFLSTIPLGRFSQPEDMGEAAAFLCSDAAGMITGTALEVDGGRCI